MEAPYTKFSQTKLVPVLVWHQNQQIESDTWDCDYWVETPEDWYGLMSSNLVNKKVRVITRNEWLKAKPVIK